MESDKKTNKRLKNPRASANIISALTFSWTYPVFWKGYRKGLTEDDIPEVLDDHNSAILGDQIQKLWEEELANAARKKKKPSFLRVAIKFSYRRLMLLGIVWLFSETVLKISQPLLLGGLIRYFSQPADATNKITKETAYMYAGGVILCSTLVVVMMHPSTMAIVQVGMKLRVATCSLIYRHALQLSKTALGQTTPGQIVNLISNDVNRFDICFLFMHILWIGPLQTCLVTYLLYDLIGPSTFVGIAFLLSFIPLQGWLGKMSSKYRLKNAMRTDERVRLMNEIISGIQVIKMYTWEKPFAALVENARRREIKGIKTTSYIRGVTLSFIVFHARSAIFVTILSYVLLGNSINAEKVFVVISLYGSLRQTMSVFFPQGITQVAEGLISVKRIQNFLMINEKAHLSSGSPFYKSNGKMDSDKLSTNSITNLHNQPKQSYTKPGIFIKNASAKWQESSHDNTLSNVTVDIIPGQLTAIIGPVGSGKTSLLNAILRELPLTSGYLDVNGEISYASQEPWLFQGSVRQNILFGKEYNRERYREVVRVCSLKTDFEQFPYGDKTIVGERGVSLSGGQRARINLARAVYKDADIYLLDDPLSAVDTHVGKHLFEDCIQGYLKNKTVILVTHQLQYLENVNQLVLLENGNVKAIGSFKTLQDSGLDFTKLMAKEKEPEPVKEKEEPPPLVRRLISRQNSIQSVASTFIEEAIVDAPQMIAETQGTGSIGGRVYKAYLTAGAGCCKAMFVFLMCVISQGFASLGDWWITYWVNLEEHVLGKNNTYTAGLEQNASLVNSSLSSNVTETDQGFTLPFMPSRNDCIIVYTSLTIGAVVLTLTRSFMFFSMCMRASVALHNKMFESVTRATMWFFNNNTSGRVLNRFSKDMGTLDEILPMAMIDVIQISISILAIVSLVILINPLFSVPSLLCGIFFYFLRKFYLSTSRTVKRLEGVTRSPVFSHFNASLQGLTTIRAFQAEQILIKEFDDHQNLHSSSWYYFLACTKAFGYLLDLVCLMYIALVTLSFLVLGGETMGGNVGLAISQTIGLTGLLQWGMRQSAELENQMTSVERVLEYSELESEPPLESSPDKKPRKTWPEHGKIEFVDVYLRYSAADPWILKDLNFTIMPKEKVGVVGRTGAGKSSLINALFRLSEVDGSILIDDIDGGNMGLHELRSKISIIPQEPVLFSGTLRKNLDPFDDHNDDVLWSALEEVELKETVKEMVGGLQAIISEGGSNLSVGQRQLVCLARAIVRNNRILVLDEATANVDPQTDGLIQQTIRVKFLNCTVVTIAHRLNTVMDSDKILVMDAGSLAEFDHPHLLLQNEDGIFTSMVRKTGKATEELLRKIARENYERQNIQIENEPETR